MKHHEGKFIVPTYDMDLMWHAHQMYPAAYQKVYPYTCASVSTICSLMFAITLACSHCLVLLY